MKVLVSCLVFVSALFAWAAQPIQVKIEQRVAVFDAPPMEREGVAMVPLRGMVDTMDGTMKWNMETNTVTCWKNSRKFEVILHSRDAKINGKSTMLEVGPFIHRGRIYVPLRFVAEAAGYLVSQENGWFVLHPSETRSR